MTGKQLSFVIELDRCIGCASCQAACHMENGTPLGSHRIRVLQAGPFGVFPDLSMYFLPSMCQQCEAPDCARVCPSGAIKKNGSDGTVTLDAEICTGCGSCVRACPYGALSLSGGTADKCDLCTAARADGREPSCVSICPGRALHLGDVSDPESAVSALIESAGPEHVFSLRDSGSHPTVRYILRRGEWHDLLPQELRALAERGGRRP